MTICLKSMILHPMQLFKVVALVIMVSIPLVAITMTDYLSFNSFIASSKNTTLEMSLHPSDESVFQTSEDIQSALQTTGYCRNMELFYQDLVSASVTSSERIVASDMLRIGLSNLTLDTGSTGNNSIALLWDDAESLGLSLGEVLNISGPSIQTLTIGAFVNITANQLERIENIINKFGRPESYLMIFGSIGQIRNLTLQFESEIADGALSNYIHIACNVIPPDPYISNPSALTAAFTRAINNLEAALEVFGEVESSWTPLNQWESIRTQYVQLETNVNLVVWPTFVLSLAFLYLALGTMTILRRRDFAIMMVRGASRSQLNKTMVTADILVALIGGLLSIPFGVLMTHFLMQTNSIWDGMNWLGFALQDPVLLILTALVLSITVSVASSLSSLRYLRNFELTGLLSKETIQDSKRSQDNLFLFGIVVSILVFLESLLDYPILNTIINLGKDSPSLSMIARLLMYLEISMLAISPFVIGIAFSMLVSRWHPHVQKALSRVNRKGSDTISLLSKSFAMPHKRAESISALMILIVFFSNFLGVFYGTGMQMKQAEQTLLIGGNLKIHIEGDNIDIDDIAVKLNNFEDVQLISVCSSLIIGVKGDDSFFRDGPLYVVDDAYFNSSSSRANHLQDLIIPNRTIMASSGFAEYARINDVITISWDFENKSESEIGGYFQFIPGFHESVFQYQEIGSTSWAFLVTRSDLEQLKPNLSFNNHYLLIDMEGDSSKWQSSIEILLDALLLPYDDASYMIESGSYDLNVQSIEDAYFITLIAYLAMMGAISISMVIVLTVRERWKEMLVIRARGASGKRILSSLLLYYLSLLLPLFLIGIMLSTIYTYALKFAPIKMLLGIEFQGTMLILPNGYSISVPYSVIITDMVLLGIVTAIIIYSTVRVWKARRMITETL